MNELTPERLQAIRERCAKASEGPLGSGAFGVYVTNTAELMVHARQDLPDLLAAYEALQAAAKASHERAERLAAPLTWTTEKPTQPGWYWAINGSYAEIVSVSPAGWVVMMGVGSVPADYFQKYCGPLPLPPAEPK